MTISLNVLRCTVENAIAPSDTKECDRFNQKADNIIPVDCMIFQYCVGFA
ncbi:hypothetical protein [Nostoc sp.]